MSDDVRQAAREILEALDGAMPTKCGEPECAGECVREAAERLRAALASGERGEYERGVEDAAKCCEAFARKHGGVFEEDGTVSRGPMFVAATNCAAAIRSLAAPAENDAGRGE